MSANLYKNAHIHFWSGTGNSYKVATWVKQVLENKAIKSKIISIEKGEQVKGFETDERTLPELFFPLMALRHHGIY